MQPPLCFPPLAPVFVSPSSVSPSLHKKCVFRAQLPPAEFQWPSPPLRFLLRDQCTASLHLPNNTLQKSKTPNVRILTVMLLVNPGLRKANTSTKMKWNASIGFPCKQLHWNAWRYVYSVFCFLAHYCSELGVWTPANNDISSVAGEIRRFLPLRTDTISQCCWQNRRGITQAVVMMCKAHEIWVN